MPLVTVREAAVRLRVGYSTLKQWIYKGKIHSVQGPGGHHRIPQSEIDRLTQVKLPKHRRKTTPALLNTISGRNKLLGIVESVRHDGLLAEVKINISGQFVTAIITSESCKQLGLKRGSKAYALIKSTEVMIVTASS